jgi:hypothetical protein
MNHYLVLPHFFIANIGSRSYIITFPIPVAARRNSWDREIRPNRDWRLTRNCIGISARADPRCFETT